MADTLGFLVGDISRLMRRAFDVRARTIGVTRPQWRMLTTLSRHEGVNQGRLADLLDVEAITLCRMVDRLSEADLVERRPDPTDRRAWRIYLTDRARPILGELRSLADDLIEETLDGVSAAERETLMTLLERIRINLNDERKEKTAANG
ncbi:putative MarR family transcriptional regulator [Sphingomonas changbaiensis NBRC 104936]|uniref:Putative MarR family transcriptional regulator n=1 Tax=Sphingomonas changbaiensis NBRC 104936 TaxID=1219043 RepID=A0A0E9MM84_9SPHN|nr:MarR family transcriptional regulator [Sphingomonas changbaiensis]GAO38618.1 putative MarR family transcriptional regulator [Sphingomonas changbaiensis NBRC 104936]